MESQNSIKNKDDRPRPLWRLNFKDYDKNGCRMHNIPIEVFICSQTGTCPLHCTQKNDQHRQEDYVRDQRMKTLTKIEKVIKRNGKFKKSKH